MRNKITRPRQRIGPYTDPLYKYIPLTRTLRKAIDLPTMQRLRRMRQLSAVELVYPGATHNRLEHSIGVYHLATIIFDALANRWIHEEREWPILSPIHKLAVQLAALFHDVGHGPFSHVFELYSKRNPKYGKYRHETVTEEIIKNGTYFPDIKNFLNDEYQKQKDDIEQLGVGGNALIGDIELLLPENIAALATGKAPPAKPEYNFLAQIISGEFDADRMDYLQRDAMHIGVASGDVDVWSIIYRLTLVKEKIDDKESWQLKIEPSAAESIENLLTIRDLAYRRVYYHPTHRVAQEMLIRAMHSISEYHSSSYSKEDLLKMTDEELISTFLRIPSTSLAKNIGKRIRNRDLYEPLPFEINVGRDLDEKGKKRFNVLAEAPLTGPEFTNRIDAEREAAENITLAVDETVIFDVERTPIADVKEYKKRFFYNESAKDDERNLALIDLLPHLELYHGGHDDHKLHVQLTEEVSKLLVFVPFDYITHAVGLIANNLVRLNNREKKKKEKSTKDEYLLSVQRVLLRGYKNHFLPVIDNFLEYLHSSENEELKIKIQVQVLNYLESELIN